MRIIGIAGNAQSGKDTIGNLLKNMLNIDLISSALREDSLLINKIVGINPTDFIKWETVQYATALKRSVHELFNLPPDINKDYPYSDEYTVRNLYQIIGTDVARKINPDIFIDILFRKIHSNKDKNFIITDVRFPNEAKAIKEYGGIIIKKEASKPSEDIHESESYIDNIEADYIVPWVSEKDVFEIFKFEEILVDYLEKNILTKDERFNYGRK